MKSIVWFIAVVFALALVGAPAHGDAGQADASGGYDVLRSDEDAEPGPEISTDPDEEDAAPQETVIPQPQSRDAESQGDEDGGLGKDYFAPGESVLTPEPGHPGVWPDEDNPYEQ